MMCERKKQGEKRERTRARFGVPHNTEIYYCGLRDSHGERPTLHVRAGANVDAFCVFLRAVVAYYEDCDREEDDDGGIPRR